MQQLLFLTVCVCFHDRHEEGGTGATCLLAMRLRTCFWMVTAAPERRALRAARAACRLPSSVALRKLLRVRWPRTAA